MSHLSFEKCKRNFYFFSHKRLLRIPFLTCFLLSLISQGASSQTTIDFNDLAAGSFFGRSYIKNGFIFSINLNTGSGEIVSRNNEGYQSTISLYDNNLTPGAITQWTIRTIDGAAFQFRSIYLQEPNVGASTSGTIQGFKNGNPVGNAKSIDFNSKSNGLKNFESDPDFYDVQEIRINALDINFHLDHFTYGPVYVPVDTAPATVSSISILGSPGPFATSISYSINFNKPVIGVSTDDFQLTTTSTVTGDINSVSGSGSSYTVTVNNISGIGTIRLELKGGTNIANTNGNTGTPAYTSGPVHTLSDCGVETFEAGTILDGANSFASNGKTFMLSTGFEIESKTGFGAISPGGSALSNKYIKNNNTAGKFSISSSQDFTMSSVDLFVSNRTNGDNPTANGSLIIRGKRDGQIQYTITKTNGFPTSTSVNGGFLTINFATAGVGNYRNVNIDELEFTIADGFVELLVDNFNHCQVAPDVDVLAPKVISIIPDPAALSNSSNVNFQVIFDENASGVSIDDFALSTTGTVSGAITGVAGSGSVYTVSVTGISGQGSIRVDLAADNNILDALNNSPSPAFTSGQQHLVGACFIETFEDETDGAKSFTGNGITFNLVGNWEIDRATPSTGIYGSKVNTVSTGAGPYSIISTDGHFVAKRLALYVSSLASGTSPTNNGTVKIRGYMGGNMRYEWNQLGGFPTDFTSNNGYFIVDLETSFDAEIEVLKIDRLEITLGGSFVYFSLDNFEWCADNLAPGGYSVSIDQESINSTNQNAVSFTFAGAELGTRYNYTFTSTGGGTPVTGQGTVTSNNQKVSGINLSGLEDGTITLSVTLTDDYENVGASVSDAVIKLLILPVDLISFNAIREPTGIRLNWLTTNERDNREFVIYRSQDAKNWKVLDRMVGKGGTTTVSYSMIDVNPFKGINYYRLLQIDMDGTENDLGIRAADFTYGEEAWMAFPNPVVDKVTVRLERGKYTYAKLCDFQGNEIRSWRIEAETDHLTIDMSDVKNGFYLLGVQSNTGWSFEKIIKQ